MKITKDEIQLINALYSVASVQAKNCLVDGNTVAFLVDEKAMGKAIGRQGANIKSLSSRLGKAVEILPYASTGQDFVRKVLKTYKIKLKGLEEKAEDSKKVLLLTMDLENKSKLLRNTGRLRRLKQILKNDFEIENIKVR